jgi:hypothetical protein
MVPEATDGVTDTGGLVGSAAGMDASAALTELVGLSTQVVEVVIAGPGGDVEAAHPARDTRAHELASAGQEALTAASDARPDGPAVERVHVDLERGSFVVVRDDTRTIVATTVAEPTAGLVAYDLRVALRRAGEGTP